MPSLVRRKGSEPTQEIEDDSCGVEKLREDCPLGALASIAVATSASGERAKGAEATPPRLRSESIEAADVTPIDSEYGNGHVDCNMQGKDTHEATPHRPTSGSVMTRENDTHASRPYYYPSQVPPFGYWGYPVYYHPPPPAFYHAGTHAHSTGTPPPKPPVVSPATSSSLAPRHLSDLIDEASVSTNKRRASMGKWSEEEDEILKLAVHEYGGKSWKRIAGRLPGRTDVQCLHRWQKVLRPGLVKGPWTTEEDATVTRLVKKYGTKKWSLIARHLNGRLGKQCRERWYNHLVRSLVLTICT